MLIKIVCKHWSLDSLGKNLDPIHSSLKLISDPCNQQWQSPPQPLRVKFHALNSALSYCCFSIFVFLDLCVWHCWWDYLQTAGREHLLHNLNDFLFLMTKFPHFRQKALLLIFGIIPFFAESHCCWRRNEGQCVRIIIGFNFFTLFFLKKIDNFF